MIACSLLAALAFAGEITGCHFNPCVTISTLFCKKIENVSIYFLSQITGGVIGALLFYGMKGNSVKILTH